jgi:hypothetical protein
MDISIIKKASLLFRISPILFIFLVGCNADSNESFLYKTFTPESIQADEIVPSITPTTVKLNSNEGFQTPQSSQNSLSPHPPTNTPTPSNLPIIIDTLTPTNVPTPTKHPTPSPTFLPTNTATPHIEITLNDPSPLGESTVLFSWQLDREQPLRQTECFAFRLGNSPDDMIVHSIFWGAVFSFEYQIDRAPGIYYWNVALIVDKVPGSNGTCDGTKEGEVEGVDFEVLKNSILSTVEFNFTTRVAPPSPPP